MQERLRWSYEQSKRGDFVRRMSDELYRKGVLLMRFHVSGDIYSPALCPQDFGDCGPVASYHVLALYPELACEDDLSAH